MCEKEATSLMLPPTGIKSLLFHRCFQPYTAFNTRLLWYCSTTEGRPDQILSDIKSFHIEHFSLFL